MKPSRITAEKDVFLLIKSASVNGAGLLISFITAILLAKILSPEQRGLSGKATTMMAIFATLTSMSVPVAIVKNHLHSNVAINRVASAYKKILPFTIGCGAVVFFFYSSNFLEINKKELVLISLLGALVIGFEHLKGVVYPVSVQHNEFWPINTARLVSPLAYGCLLLLFFLTDMMSVLAVIFCYSLSQLLGFVPFYFAKRSRGVLFSSHSLPADSGRFLKLQSLIGLHSNSFFFLVNSNFDKIVLSLLFSDDLVGKYFAAVSIASIPNLIISPLISQLSGAFQPDMNEEIRRNKETRYILIFSAVLLLSLIGYYYIGAALLQFVFGENYANGIRDVFFLIPLGCSVQILKQLASYFLAIRGQEVFGTGIEVMQLVCGVVLCFLFFGKKIEYVIALTSILNFSAFLVFQKRLQRGP